MPSHVHNKRALLPSPSPGQNYDEWAADIISRSSKADLRGGSKTFVHELRNERIIFSLSALSGCTSLLVVSDTQVYLTHFWQLPSFISRPPGGGQVPAGDDDFFRTVRDPLYNGKAESEGVGLFDKLSNYKGAFDTATTDPEAYIITPSSDQAGNDLRYLDRVTQITGYVQELLGDARGKWRGVISPLGYFPRAGADDKKNGRGKILVLYDPAAEIDTEAVQNGCAYVQVPRLRIYFQDAKPIVDRTWTPYAYQKVEGVAPRTGGSNKRSLALEVAPNLNETLLPWNLEPRQGACSLTSTTVTAQTYSGPVPETQAPRTGGYGPRMSTWAPPPTLSPSPTPTPSPSQGGPSHPLTTTTSGCSVCSFNAQDPAGGGCSSIAGCTTSTSPSASPTPSTWHEANGDVPSDSFVLYTYHPDTHRAAAVVYGQDHTADPDDNSNRADTSQAGSYMTIQQSWIPYVVTIFPGDPLIIGQGHDARVKYANLDFQVTEATFCTNPPPRAGVGDFDVTRCIIKYRP